MPLLCNVCKHLPAGPNTHDWFDERWWREPCGTCRLKTRLWGNGIHFEPRDPQPEETTSDPGSPVA